MTSVVDQAPHVAVEDAARLVRELYGIAGELRLLPSERDQNFSVRTAEGAGYVLKIANAAEDPQRLDFQNAALAHLADRITDFALPQVPPPLDGARGPAARAAPGRWPRRTPGPPGRRPPPSGAATSAIPLARA